MNTVGHGTGYQHILNLRRHLLVLIWSKIMAGKIVKKNKEVKKQAALSPKEKKTAKQTKKHASDIVPLVHR
jgi:hypothetical protein